MISDVLLVKEICRMYYLIVNSIASVMGFFANQKKILRVKLLWNATSLFLTKTTSLYRTTHPKPSTILNQVMALHCIVSFISCLWLSLYCKNKFSFSFN